jgi:hypothetical protein
MVAAVLVLMVGVQALVADQLAAAGVDIPTELLI